MTPAARYQASIALLEKTGHSSLPMDSAVGDWLRFRKYIGSKDRADIVERVYGAARAYARLGWHLARHGHEDTPRARILAFARLVEGMDPGRIESLFDGTKYAPVSLSDSERELVRKLAPPLDAPDMQEGVRVECPPRFESALRDFFGDSFAQEMAAMIVPATLDLRVNLRRTDRESARASLAADGVDSDPTPFSPCGLRVRGKAFLSQTRAFREGLVEIQDEGSQLVALLCGARPGAQALDYCAGAGGKTLALASAMANKGRVVAMDTQAGRLEKARARLRRAGVSDIVEIRPLSDEKQRRWLKRQKGVFDVALADVPCGGSGTWRRNPDMRWREYGPGAEALAATQSDILDHIASTIKPGGRLVYATCSLLPSENEARVESFLARRPEFSIAPLAEVWSASGLGSPPPGAGPFLRLSPLRHNTDGFFAAVMTRKTPDS